MSRTKTIVYDTEPLSFCTADDGAIIEIIRGIGEPLLVVRVEGQSTADVFHRIVEMNDDLRSYGFSIPYPDGDCNCPTCGHPVCHEK